MDMLSDHREEYDGKGCLIQSRITDGSKDQKKQWE